MRKLLLVLVISFSLASISSSNFPVFSQNTETISLTTYYPSPVGVYRELRAQRAAIGDTYYDASQYCWPPDTCLHPINATADLVVEGPVGIGTSDINPYYILSVRDDLSSRFSGASETAVMRISAPRRPWLHWVAEKGLDGNTTANAFALGIGVDFNGTSYNRLYLNYDNTPGNMTTQIMSFDRYGAVGIGTATPNTKLDVDGEVKIGNTGMNCTANKAGAMRYFGEIQYCDGSSWKAISQPPRITVWPSGLVYRNDPLLKKDIGVHDFCAISVVDYYSVDETRDFCQVVREANGSWTLVVQNGGNPPHTGATSSSCHAICADW